MDAFIWWFGVLSLSICALSGFAVTVTWLTTKIIDGAKNAYYFTQFLQWKSKQRKQNDPT